MDETKFKNTIAKNIADFRKQLNLTQAELAEKLNYSDKSISKWERAEAVPDAFVLKQLADFFNITIDRLMSDAPVKKQSLSQQRRKKIIITILSFSLVYLIATVVYSVLAMFAPTLPKTWMCFIFAIPVSAIVLIVFSSMWGKKITIYLSESLLNWSAALLIFLLVKLNYSYTIFYVAAALQVLILLWYFLKKSK